MRLLNNDQYKHDLYVWILNFKNGSFFNQEETENLSYLNRAYYQ